MSQFGHETLKRENATVPDCFDVDRIDTSQLRAKCVQRMIKITIKIEIRNSQKYKL